MSTRLEMTDAFIKVLARSNANQRKLLLREGTNQQLKGLFELCLNIIRGNLPINNTEFHRLKRHRKTLESLASRRVPLYKKREIVNQKGGFIGAVAKFAVPLLASIIASKLRK